MFRKGGIHAQRHLAAIPVNKNDRDGVFRLLGDYGHGPTSSSYGNLPKAYRNTPDGKIGGVLLMGIYVQIIRFFSHCIG